FDGKVVEYIKWQDGNWMYSEDDLYWYFEKKHAHSELQQITGLKDKKGKEIFEGDVVELRDARKVIEWSSETASFKPVLWGYTFAIASDSEVIGNVYQNPELLN